MGADLVGVAPARLDADQAPGGPKAYKKWVEQGMHATMAYMARDPEARSSIESWFPAARSVVLLGFSYGPAEGTAEPGEGRFAGYCLSPDYHVALKAKARSLLAWIRQAVPEAKGKAFVDSSPVLERLYARYAGLGWVGKNTMLLHRRLGSFFFLTGLALDQELVPDRPASDHCGSCTRCLDACPTDAFPEPRVLDASRCVAYFNIELRGSVPEEFRKEIGSWVFGCDACQDVCPWNRFSAQNPLFPRKLPASAPLENLAALTPEEFERRFGDTPVERAGFQGLLRNVLLAMGNSGDPRHIPALERHAGGPDPVVSEQARWSLERLRRN